MALLSDSRTGCRLTLAAGTELARWFTMLLAASLSTSAESLAGEIGAAPTELAAFAALERPKPTHALRYGPAPAQGIDVFLPSGTGPFPVVVLIHGGCWSDLPGAGREQLRHLGADLATEGIAVWSIGYRRADEPGGGYPGTFNDVAEAIDLLRSAAPRWGLDLTRTVVAGHSAGGHLALWAAARSQLPDVSPLARPNPVLPGAVVSLAGIGDIRAFAPQASLICGAHIIERLTDGDEAYAEISPAEMSAPDVPVVMISGILDRLVPPYVADDFARAKPSSAIELINIPKAGHFDLVMPGTPAHATVLRTIHHAFRSAPPAG